MQNYLLIQFLTDNSLYVQTAWNWGQAKTPTYPLLIFPPFNNLSDKVSPHLHNSHLDLLSSQQVSTCGSFTIQQLRQGLRQRAGSFLKRSWNSMEVLSLHSLCKLWYEPQQAWYQYIHKHHQKTIFFLFLNQHSLQKENREALVTTSVSIWLVNSNQLKWEMNTGTFLKPTGLWVYEKCRAN